MGKFTISSIYVDRGGEKAGVEMEAKASIAQRVGSLLWVFHEQGPRGSRWNSSRKNATGLPKKAVLWGFRFVEQKMTPLAVLKASKHRR